LNSPADARPAAAGPDSRLAGDALRQQLRARRRQLGGSARAAATAAITRHVATTRWLQGARPVGLYVSVGLEVGTEALRALARRRRCPVYLPRIVDYRRYTMLFARDRDELSLINRHGIPEP